MALKWCKLYQKVTYTHNIHIVKFLQLNSFSTENKTTCGFQICALAKMWKNLFFVLISRLWLKLRLVSLFSSRQMTVKEKSDSIKWKKFGVEKKKMEKGKKKKQTRIKIFDEVMQRKWNETLFSFNGNVLLFFVYFYFWGLKNCLHNGEQIKGSARILRKYFFSYFIYFFKLSLTNNKE